MKPRICIICSKNQYLDVLNLYENLEPFYEIVLPYDFWSVVFQELLQKQIPDSIFAYVLKEKLPKQKEEQWLQNKLQYTKNKIESAHSCLILDNVNKGSLESYFEKCAEIDYLEQHKKAYQYWQPHYNKQLTI